MLVVFSCIKLPSLRNLRLKSLLLNKLPESTYLNYLQILDWKGTREYWFVVLGKELK